MNTFVQFVLTIAGILVLQLPMSQSTTGLPPVPSGHLASDRFSAWLAAFNTADEQTLRRCLTDDEFPSYVGNISLRFARRTGGFDVVDVEDSSDPSSLVILLKGRNHPVYARASIIVDISKPPYPVTNFDIGVIATPLEFIPTDDPRRPQLEKALQPLTPELRRAVVDGVVDVLRNQYIYQERIEEIIAVLRACSEKDGYNGFVKSEKFANHLRKELDDLGHDHGISVEFLEPMPQNLPPHDEQIVMLFEPMPENLGPHYEQIVMNFTQRVDWLRELDFGFGSVSIDIDSVPGKTIATLPIKFFAPNFASDGQEILAAIGAILSRIADADALLVDLRSNFGGDRHTMAFMLSYLLNSDEALHLLDFVTRSGEIDESIFTTPINELPSDTKRFGGTKPLYVLTNSETEYEGEGMAYSLQAFKRAQAVIGERNEATFGEVNNERRVFWICEEEFGEERWWVGVPTTRPVHAITGTNWQGVGVISDIVAGKGEWAEVHDAKEVGRILAMQDFKSQDGVQVY